MILQKNTHESDTCTGNGCPSDGEALFRAARSVHVHGSWPAQEKWDVYRSRRAIAAAIQSLLSLSLSWHRSD
eukprot:4697453-Pyramimonas_sp.AAC.1